MFSGGVTRGAGDSTNGGDLGDVDLRLPSSEHEDAASEQGRLGSEDSLFDVSVLSAVSTFFRLHLD